MRGLAARMPPRSLLLVSFLAAADALVVGASGRGSPRTAPINMQEGMWNSGLDYGKGLFRFYVGFDEFMKPFPDEDREEYPEMFKLPDGCYEVSLQKPMGIAFEEIEAGRGVVVEYLVEGSNSERQGIIKPGDVLIAATAIKVIGAKWERRLIPCRQLDFDTIMGAIGSNEVRWGCKDVILQFARPEADDDKVKEHLEFFTPPSDSPWVN